MKYLAFLILFGAAVYFIPSQPKGQFYGATFDPQYALSIAEVAKAESDSIGKYVVVKGTVESVCPKKGCWLTLKTNDGTIRSTFKNYGFFVPKDISGKEVVLSGVIRSEKIAAAIEQHFRADAGDTTKVDMPDFINKQTFLASGVFIID